MGEIRIFRAGPGRIDDVGPMWKALHEHHRAVAPDPGVPWRQGQDAWERRRANYLTWLANPDAFLLIAEDDGRPAAYALVTVADADDTNVTGARYAELRTLSVLPSHRGAGLGRRMMAGVYGELRRLGIRELEIGVVAGNEGAIRFYEREGFRPWVVHYLGTVPDDPGPPY